MKRVCFFFFYTYIGLIIVAGFFGAFINPYFELEQMFRLDAYKLSDYERINLLSQYRFLRALELGFGLFSVLFVKPIFNERLFNILFLLIMGLGILARIVSWFADGKSNYLSQFFMYYELISWISIFFYTYKIRKHHVN